MKLYTIFYFTIILIVLLIIFNIFNGFGSRKKFPTRADNVLSELSFDPCEVFDKSQFKEIIGFETVEQTPEYSKDIKKNRYLMPYFECYWKINDPIRGGGLTLNIYNFNFEESAKIGFAEIEKDALTKYDLGYETGYKKVNDVGEESLFYNNTIFDKNLQRTIYWRVKNLIYSLQLAKDYTREFKKDPNDNDGHSLEDKEKKERLLESIVKTKFGK
jgi:hypothetical protein